MNEKIRLFYELTKMYIYYKSETGDIIESDGAHITSEYEAAIWSSLESSGFEFCYYITPEALAYGCIKLSSGVLFIGPTYSENNLERQLASISSKTTYTQLTLRNIFKHLPKSNVSLFLNNMTFLYAQLNNNQFRTPNEIQIASSIHSISLLDAVPYDNGTLNHSQLPDYIEYSTLRILETGDIEALEDLFTSIRRTNFFPDYRSDTIRSLRNLCIVTTSLASRTAIHAGVDYLTAINASNIFIDQTELIADYDKLNRHLYNIICYYTNKVSEIKKLPHETPLIKSCCKYINNNLYARLTVDDIADSLGTNASYLSHLFKSKTGNTLSNYINEEKIKEASRLLRETDLPLSEIALQLAFSSQQYFQSVFKKHMGCTPGEYRKQLP